MARKKYNVIAPEWRKHLRELKRLNNKRIRVYGKKYIIASKTD